MFDLKPLQRTCFIASKYQVSNEKNAPSFGRESCQLVFTFKPPSDHHEANMLNL